MENLEIKKVTEKERYAEMKEILEEQGRQDLADFCNNKIEQITKKAEKRKTQATATQKVNEGYAKIILEVLTKFPQGVTITDLIASDNRFVENGKPLSSQKVTYILKTLKEENKVVNIKDKRKSLYKLTTIEEN